ncbi:MAG: hypothetical protein AMXMBFR33_67860 [Candidatus Xenobia bacterium]
MGSGSSGEPPLKSQATATLTPDLSLSERGLEQAPSPMPFMVSPLVGIGQELVRRERSGTADVYPAQHYLIQDPMGERDETSMMRLDAMPTYCGRQPIVV